MKGLSSFGLFTTFTLLVSLLMTTHQSSAELIGQWLFDEGDGKVAKDSSGNGHDGEFVGKLNWVDGQFATALEFDGAQSCVKISPGLEHEDFTIVAWVYSEGDWGVKRTEIWTGSQTYADSVLIRGDERADWKQGEAMLHWNDGAAWHAIGSGKLKAKTWYHLAGTYDGKELKFYLDGKLKGAEATAIRAGAGDTTIGCHPNPANWFGGIIDDVGIFDNALTEEEINIIITRGLENRLSVDPAKKFATHWAKIKNLY